MSVPRFQVHSSPVVTGQIRAVLDEARVAGRFDQVSRALRELLRTLELVPLDYGEDRGSLPSLGLIQRIAFVHPLVARYSVNEDLKRVWLQSVRLYPDS